MSLFDIFRRKKSTATPNPNAERGDWKDWFLDMENRGPFRKNRTVKPEPDAERGDWMKWFLNREGLAGKFNADPGGYIDYTPWISFNDGGYAQSGPKRRQKLQPRSLDALESVGDRYAWEGNTQGLNRIHREMNDRFVKPYAVPGTGFMQPGRPEEGRGGVGPDSFWNVKANQPDQSGIMGLEMADATDYINKMKEGYNRIKKGYDFLDDHVDRDENRINYEWNKPLWGGTLGIGGEYDFDDDQYKAGINWTIG